MPVIPPDELDAIRQEFPHTNTGRLYLNHAAIGPLPLRSRKLMEDRLADRNAFAIHTMESDIKTIARVRNLLARLVNAESADRITFQQNTSTGLNLVASGLDWDEGDEIIVNDMEFPSNVYPYLNLKERGVSTTFISTDEGRITFGDIEQAVTPSTKMIALSAVQFLSGYRADLATIGEFCKERDIWFVVDAIQALGAVQLDVQAMHIDALASGGHKWLLSPLGAGFLYISEAYQQQMKHGPLGWLSVEEPWQLFNHDQQPKQSASRYELGSPNVNGVIGMLGSLELYFDVGPVAVEEQINRLTGYLIEQIHSSDNLTLYTDEDPEHRAGIVTADLPGDTDTEQFVTTAKEFELTVSIREGKLRFAPHYYNTLEELERAFDICQRILEQQD